MSAVGEYMSRRDLPAVDSILGQIGNTPLLSFTHIRSAFDRVVIYGKAEWFNPGGSVKDRPALRMIEEGERSGALTREKIILDSSSGNTGIAYAWIGAVSVHEWPAPSRLPAISHAIPFDGAHRLPCHSTASGHQLKREKQTLA